MVGSSATKSKREEEAFNAFENEHTLPLGTYTTSYAGKSVTATIAHEFCKANDVDSGDKLDYWLDVKTGALIILPEGEV